MKRMQLVELEDLPWFSGILRDGGTAFLELAERGHPVTVTLTLPFWRPFRWPWLVWTWLVSVMQPFVLWDGLVSWLGSAPLHGTYLVGFPRPPASAGPAAELGQPAHR